jgi:hypothetical protein
MISSELTGGSFAECCEAFLENLIRYSSGLGLGFEVLSEATRNPVLAKLREITTAKSLRPSEKPRGMEEERLA